MTTASDRVVDLAEVERTMRGDAGYQRGGHTARTLVHAADLRVVLVAMRTGSRIAEHHATGSATIHALAGRVRLHLPDGTVALAAGSMLTLAPGVPHDVEAADDSTLLVTFGWRDEP